MSDKTKTYDFCGWATKNNIKCRDGITIRENAFICQDGERVPLVWQHLRNEPAVVLGNVLLENRPEGVYAYGSFNNNSRSQEAKELVHHGDITHMSIWANDLDKYETNLNKGTIREVSLVLAGANPGAMIESVVCHGETADDSDYECIVHTGIPILLEEVEEEGSGSIHHADPEPKKKEEEEPEDNPKKSEEGGETTKTVKEVINTLTDEQRKAVALVIEGVVKEKEKEEDDDVKHNIFEGKEPKEKKEEGFICHADQMMIIENAKKLGTLKDAIEVYLEENDEIKHAIDTTGMTTATGTQTYGFNDASMLFPEYKNLNNPPEWISRNMNWVSKVLGSIHRVPFSRIKSVYANITEDEARARGYIKGKEKKTEVFTTLKRTTDPQTIYKLQQMDRDDIIDITDFDVVAWIKAEMRMMLDEEIARAILIGDGRESDSNDKIQEIHIRPVAKDVPLFNTIAKVSVPADATDDDIAKETMRVALKTRSKYKGSGNPIFWTVEEYLTNMLLLEDGIGHRLYKTEGEVATALRVKEVVTVEPMENNTVTVGGKAYPLIGTIVNLYDYNVGADKGGSVSMFEDFNIRFNQHDYLIETRCSGALVKPFAAITLILDKAAAPAGGDAGEGEGGNP